MSQKHELPDNADRSWRQYHGSGFYHRYTKPWAFSNYQMQVADCGRITRTGGGSYSVVNPAIDRYHAICPKCRKLTESQRYGGSR